MDGYTEADFVRALRLCQDHDPAVDDIAQLIADVRNETIERCAVEIERANVIRQAAMTYPARLRALKDGAK